MKISRELAILILKYCFENTKFYFPFLVMCQEYSPEDDDFVEIMPDEWENIQEDEIYQTFELWENLQTLDEKTLKLMSKWFIDKILNENLEIEVKSLILRYKKLYKENILESADILNYWENEFFWWKKEAFEDILDLIKKYKL